jgi:hypothetical protein
LPVKNKFSAKSVTFSRHRHPNLRLIRTCQQESNFTGQFN